jgi:hypothetical protein
MSTPEQSGKPGEMGENPYAGLAQEPKVDGLVVERDTQGISTNTEAIPTSTEKIRPEPVFEKGQTVWIKRSSGKIQEATVGSDNGDVVITHWEEDGKVYDRPTSQAELAELQKTMGFEKDQTVWIKRSSGEVQQAIVTSVDGETVMTHWEQDGKIYDRSNNISELRDLQKTVAEVDSAAKPQSTSGEAFGGRVKRPTVIEAQPPRPDSKVESAKVEAFKRGDAVRYDDGSDMDRAYEVFNVEPDGNVRVVEKTDNTDNAVRFGNTTQVELAAMQDPSYVSRYQRGQEAKAAADAAAEAAKPKPSLRQRLANRIAGNK